jgi:hypothetical protein
MFCQRRHLLALATACACTVAPTAAAAAAWRHLDGARVVHSAAAASAAPTTLLRRAEKAFDKRRTDQDLTPTLSRLAVVLPRLHGAERQRAQRLLLRPTQGAADPQENGWSAPEASNSPLCSAHYCVHWVATGSDAPDLADSNGNGIPDYVEAVSATGEQVYARENGELGWQPAKGDGTIGGGNNLTDVYLADVGGSGIYGYSAPDEGGSSHARYAYLVLDNDFSPDQFPGYANALDPLDVTFAHEYNHVLQFGYDVYEQTWMLEATAVWMEGKVFNPVHDYLQYLPGWIQLTAQPLTSFDGNDPNNRNNVKVYGSSVWNKWLDQRFGEEVVRNAWERSVRAGSFAPAAYAAAIRAHKGIGFSDEFDRFAAATAEWQAQNSGFPEGSLYPDVDRSGQLKINGSPGTVKLNHTTYALGDIPVSSAPKIRLAMVAPKGTAAAVALVGRVGGSPGGQMVVAERRLPKGGAAVVTLTNPGDLSRLTAVLVNSDVHNSGYSRTLDDYAFTRDSQSYYAYASTDFLPPHVVRVAPHAGARVSTDENVTVTFSERVRDVSTKSVELLSGGKRVRVKLKFKPGGRQATLVPRSRLTAGGRYRVRITNGVRDLTLNRLKPERVSSFTVR